jgi:hypothetical protein
MSGFCWDRGRLARQAKRKAEEFLLMEKRSASYYEGLLGGTVVLAICLTLRARRPQGEGQIKSLDGGGAACGFVNIDNCAANPQVS